MINLFNKSGFGMDISDYSIEILELSSTSKVKNFCRTTLKPDIVKGGLILDKEKLTKKIIQLVKEAKVKSRQVVLSLPEVKTFIHVFQIPKGLKGKNLKAAVSFEAVKIIPLEQDNIYWDFQVIFSGGMTPNQTILYVATFKNIIDSYLEVLNKAGLKPIVFEIESIALGRALLTDKKIENSIMIVDLGARTTNINIFNKYKELRWSSNIPKAGNHFTQAIADEMGLSFDEAEKIKKEQGLNKESKIFTILENQMEEIITEIKNVINYYYESIDEIILVGGTALMPGIDAFFSAKLEKKISVGKALIIKQLKDESILYNTVAGLALRGIDRKKEKGAINLLPEKIQTKSYFASAQFRESHLFRIFGYIFPILSLIFLGWIVVKYTPRMPKIRNITPEEKVEKEVKKESVEEEIILLPEKIEETTEKQETAVEENILDKKEEVVKKVIIKSNSLNVRGGPGTNYEVLTKALINKEYEFLEEDNNWYKIKIDEKTQGWVFKQYAEIKEAIITEEKQLSNKELNKITVKQNSLGWLNVREGPGTNYPIVTKIYTNETYPLLQETKDWCKIKIDEGKEGWVSSQYILK